MNQNALTFVTPVKPEALAALNTLLSELGTSEGNVAPTNPSPESPLQFSEVPTLHFACMVVLDNDSRYAPLLSFELSFDGDPEAFLDDLLGALGPVLNRVYDHCAGFPAAEDRNPARIKSYFKSHSVPTAAFYVGCPGQSVQSIRNAIAVRQTAARFLDNQEGQTTTKTMNATQVHQQIQQFLEGPNGVKPEVSAITLKGQRIRAWIRLTLILLIAVPVAIALLPLIVIAVIYIRILEVREQRRPQPSPPPIDPRLLRPDVHTQNHLTTLVDVQPGRFRRNLLKFVLWATNVLARNFYTSGKLLGIPTIHFARWLLLDNDRRLLFFSNYDGSWASYLGDFVDRAAWGLTAVWGNTVEFPPPRFLLLGGARNIGLFKLWSRQHNVFAPVFYSAYPDETLLNLLRDIQFRDTVGKTLNAEQAAALLRLL